MYMFCSHTQAEFTPNRVHNSVIHNFPVSRMIQKQPAPPLPVAIARPLRPELTPEKAVQRLRDIPGYRQEVVDVIVSRAPEDAVVGGREALRRYVDGLLNDREAVVSDLGPRVAYGDRREGQQFLHAPLDPALPNLPDNHRQFVAARYLENWLRECGQLEEGRTLRLLTPPLASGSWTAEPSGVDVTVFPTWFVCERVETPRIGERDRRGRRLVRWQDLDPAGGRRRYQHE